MRKLVLVGALATATAVFGATIPQAALAGCNGGDGYAYASPAYRFHNSPWGDRCAFSPYYAGWGWRGWGQRSRGWGGRHWGQRRCLLRMTVGRRANGQSTRSPLNELPRLGAGRMEGRKRR